MNEISNRTARLKLLEREVLRLGGVWDPDRAHYLYVRHGVRGLEHLTTETLQRDLVTIKEILGPGLALPVTTKRAVFEVKELPHVCRACGDGSPELKSA